MRTINWGIVKGHIIKQIEEDEKEFLFEGEVEGVEYGVTIFPASWEIVFYGEGIEIEEDVATEGRGRLRKRLESELGAIIALVVHKREAANFDG